MAADDAAAAASAAAAADVGTEPIFMNTFKSLGLSERVLAALSSMGFSQPTPIQAQGIPPILTGRNLVGCAATGSGKTLAFGLPLVEKLSSGNGTGLVLCPTRELALQIHAVFEKLLTGRKDIRTAVLIGGSSMGPQIRALRNHPNLIVATPGRLIDHMRQKNIQLATCRTVVLDEADRMLDMGFAPQIETIMRQIPTDRQTILFSATFPPETKKLVTRLMKDPVHVQVSKAKELHPKIQESSREIGHEQKNSLLVDELNAREGLVLIFTRTKHRTDRLFKYLNDYGYPVSRIHGGRTQAQRVTAIQGFQSRKFRILVATDVAARGIDVPDVAHVINYDLPQTAEEYTHRIGRTGRAGATGCALSFVTPQERRQWQSLRRTKNA